MVVTKQFFEEIMIPILQVDVEKSDEKFSPNYRFTYRQERFYGYDRGKEVEIFGKKIEELVKQVYDMMRQYEEENIREKSPTED